MLFIRNVNIFIPTLISDEILTVSAKLITGNGIFCKFTEKVVKHFSTKVDKNEPSEYKKPWWKLSSN